MKLPFHYQFILAPFVTVILLAGLVAYTLLELAHINRENEVFRQWEILTDRIQTAISSATRLNLMIREPSVNQDIRDNDNFFSYLEQGGIFIDNLYDSTLLEQTAPDLQQQIKNYELLFRDYERADPMTISNALIALLPKLEYQYKIFAAQRRVAFIDNHRHLLASSSRLTTILLTGLILCILLASGLAIWSVALIRKRLNKLSHRAQRVTSGDYSTTLPLAKAHDELDTLDICLTNMTTRLLNLVGTENILRGAENERRRIAMDMHDGVLADLTTINRTLDSLTTNLGDSNGMAMLRTDIDNTINNLRHIIDDLHPQILETLGLESALESYLTRHSEVIGFPNHHFEFAESLENQLTNDCKLNLFRIVTEAINNVVKHAHCDQLEICLRVILQQLIITVEDNGVGITHDGKNPVTAHGYGCTNILERAQLIDAQVEWRSARFSSGTCFELRLPLPKSSALF